MKFMCLCGKELNSTQSLFNHVKGSSPTAVKHRRVCEKIVGASIAVQTTASPIGRIQDVITQEVNAWSCLGMQDSSTAVVIYDASMHDDNNIASESPDDPKDVLQEVLSALEKDNIFFLSTLGLIFFQ
ncbi:hypothetical protein BGZ94_000815 [Podila epigama]|nr:hypothetical protein BGZ94_000815 [Podila epigama]